MDQDEYLYLLDPRCRLCRTTDASLGRIPVFQNDRMQHQFVSEMISSCTAVKIYDHDRLPQHVCGRCLEELREVYVFWKKCTAAQTKRPLCGEGKEEECYRCRICSVEECDELFSLDYPSSDGEMLISDMLQAVTNLAVVPGDGLAPYICNDCLNQLEAVCDFQRMCLQTEDAFLSDTIHAWEKMEFQKDQPTHLVVELFTKPLFVTPQQVRCSVCGLERSIREIKNRCEGCLLDFCGAEWPDPVSEPDSPMKLDNESEADEEVEMLVVLEESDIGAESDEDWTPDDRKAKQSQMMQKSRLPVKSIPRRTSVKDLSALPTKNISKNLARLKLQMEDHFEIVSSSPGATHQTIRLKTFLCCGCNRFFLTDVAFRKHLRKYHKKPTNKPTFSCGICNTSFGTKRLFLSHKEKVDSRLYTYCKICDIVLLLERSFVRHQMLNHLTDQQLHEIENQFVQSVSKKCRPVESVPDGDITCDDCGGKFTSKEDLSNHYIENIQFICQQKDCNYSTKNRNFIIVHCVIGDHSQKSTPVKRNVSKEVQLEGEIDEDDSPDWNPEQSESDDEQLEPTNKHRVLPPKLIPDSISTAKCAAWLEQQSLTMEDVFDILHSTPGGSHQYLRRKIPICCGCNVFIINEEALLKHREEFHPKQQQADPNLTCLICRTTLPTKKRFSFHRDKKDCLIYNYCIPCDRVFLDEKAFIYHHYSQHITERERAKLTLQFSTVTVKKCKRYVQTSFGELTGATTDFRCPHCRRYYATKDKLEEHVLETVEFSCRNEGCDFKAKNKMSMIVHCSIGDHWSKKDDSLLKGMTFKKIARKFDESMPVAAEKVEDLSQAIIPSKKLQIFLKGNSLQMEDIFDVLGSIENSYLRCLKLRRKKPLCCACNVMFMSEPALSAHMKKEHSTRPTGDYDPEFVCKMCFTVCNTKTGFRAHTDRLNIKNRRYTYCKICDCVLLSSSFARHNMSLHLTNEKLREIESQFTTLTSFGCRDTDSLIAISEGRYVCACKCGKKFETFKSGNAHKGRSQDVMLYCKVEGCCYQTNRKHDMYEHCMEEAHTKEVKDGVQVDAREIVFPEQDMVYFKCCVPKCKIRYTMEDKLMKHLVSAHGSATEKLDEKTCRYCRESFPSKEERRKHMNRRFDCKIFRCPNASCKHSTEYLTNMQMHFKSCKAICPSKSWKCPKSKISESFVEVGKLDNMIDIIEGKGAFCCGCRRIMESEAELEQHLREQHGTPDPNRQFHCPKCNKGFKLKCIQESHVKESTERRYFYCRICNIILSNEMQVKHHKTYIHAFGDRSNLAEFYDTIKSDGLPCCGCDAKFDTLEGLAEHCQSAHPPPPILNRLMCPNCYQQLANFKTLTSHCAKYGCPVYYKCKIGDCTVQTKLLSKIERHVSASSHEDSEHFRKHLANPQTFYCCILRCNFSSHSYDLLIDHGIAEHVRERQERSIVHKDRPIVCPVCCKGFNMERQLANHRNCAVLIQCEVCSCKIKTPEYQAHLENCRKTYSKTCTHCTRVFRKYRSYQAHYKKIHAPKTSRPKVVCTICGEMVSERCMADHIASHENKRAWQCDLCSLRFNSKTVLALHIRRVHSTDRRFPCKVDGCDKTYRYDIDRVRHEMVVHFHDKPFGCAYCPETFVRNRDLQLHMRHHTGRKLYCCSKCRAEFDLKREFVEHEKHCDGAAYGDNCVVYEEYIVEEVV